MVIYVAAIQGIPESLIEAAKIDGANAWERIKAIVFPMVAPAFTASLFLTMSRSLMVYDVNVSLTGGEPARATELIAMEILSKAYKELNSLRVRFRRAVLPDRSRGVIDTGLHQQEERGGNVMKREKTGMLLLEVFGVLLGILYLFPFTLSFPTV